MGQLRLLLSETQGLQAQFIAERFYQSMPTILSAVDAEQRPILQQRIEALANSTPPYGLYALIDYVHFKGTGVLISERYQGEGWGLVQVLSAMPAQSSSLEDFIVAGEQVLRRRVHNAPPERNETRWLQGWINRLQTYRPDSRVLDGP